MTESTITGQPRRGYFSEPFRRIREQREKYLKEAVPIEKPPEKSRRYHKRFWRRLQKYLTEFSRMTSLHGVLFIFEKRTRFEKVFWICVMILSLVACVYTTYYSFQTFRNQPVIISLGTEETPVYDMVHPAVTICPESKAQKNKFDLDGVMEAERELTAYESDNLEYMYLLCDHPVENLDFGRETFEEDFFTSIDEIKPDFVDMFFRCELWGNRIPCDQFFFPVVTDQGICYSFNMLDRQDIFKKNVDIYGDMFKAKKRMKNWDPELGYLKSIKEEDAYPLRNLFSGIGKSLKLLLKINKSDVDVVCKSYQKGFRVMIHHPMDIPRFSYGDFRVPLNKLVSVSIIPQLTISDEEVKGLSIRKRKCFLQHERLLAYFKVYTKRNCMLECLTKFTLDKCSCVDSYMPRNRQTPICGSAKYVCMQDAARELEIKEMQSKVDKNKNSHCNCEPPCTEIAYSVEAVHVDWPWQSFYENQYETAIEAEKKRLNYESDEMSMLLIYFKTPSIWAVVRHELYGFVDLISRLGGFLGLFTGVSLMTALELIYFFTLRIYCNRKLYSRWFGTGK